MTVLWQPDADALVQLLEVLRYGERADTASQQLVVKQLEHFSTSVSSFPAYLTYIFARSGDESSSVRLRAGLSLQNSVKQRVAAFPPDILEYVKQTIFDVFEDPNAQIRNTASSVLDWLFRSIGPLNWPQAIVKLYQCMNTQSLVAREAAYKAIANISKQSPRVLADLQLEDQRPWDAILPTLILSGLTSESVSIRTSSLDAIIPFIVSQPISLQQHLHTFLSNLFNLTSDPDLGVRKAVVEALNSLLSFWPEQIVPHIEPVIEYMLYCLQSKNEEEDLALTAAEFLLTFTEESDIYEQLQLHLDKFLPGLLQALTFTPNSREVLDLQEEDYRKEDKATDIKPHIHKSRTTGANTGVPSLAARLGMTADDVAAARRSTTGEDEDKEEEDEEKDDEDDDSTWTVRKAAATALESSAEMFEGALLEILLPPLTKMLSHGDWYQREAAIHALGDICLGCATSMHEHLPALIPYLLESLKDTNPLIRSTAAWTLGGYSTWIAKSSTSGNNFLPPTLQGILTVALDNNKHAQGNAITAFGSLAKASGPNGSLGPYLPSIVQSFVAAFAKYQHKNTLKLYDTIAILSDGLGLGGLNNEAILNTLMPPLIARWQAFGDEDLNLLHLLECLTSVVVAASEGFRPYANPIFQRAYRIIHASLHQYQHYQADPTNVDKPEKAWLVVSLDLISSLVQGLGTDSEAMLIPFVQSSEDSTVPLLLVCMSYPDGPVRQSTYALIGDLAGKAAVQSLYPVMGQLLPILTDAIAPTPKISRASVDSNAVWAIGELAMVLGTNMEPYIPNLLDRTLPILSSIKASANLRENTAITIGRLASASPQLVSHRLSDIIRTWSQTMIHVAKGPEQDSALRGMCLAVKANPSALGGDGRWLLEALSHCQEPSRELSEVSVPIIQALQYQS